MAKKVKTKSLFPSTPKDHIRQLIEWMSQGVYEKEQTIAMARYVILTDFIELARSNFHSIYFLITCPFFRLDFGNEIYESDQINCLVLIVCHLKATFIAALIK